MPPEKNKNAGSEGKGREASPDSGRVRIDARIKELKSKIDGNKQLTERLLEEAPKIRPPRGKYNEVKIDLWKRRYSGEDRLYNERLKSYKKRKKREVTGLDKDLMEGWERLIKSRGLSIVYNVCQQEKVPFEVVFLALGESHWNGVARSNVGAGGYWQFMPATARAYGLKISGSTDERTDVLKSTKAAIRLLKDLYKQTYSWEDTKIPKDISYYDSNRWAWAFWAYNRGPAKVGRWYRILKGDPTNYAQKMAMAGRHETADYVNKIFGIRLALKHMLKNGKLKQPQQIAAPPSAPHSKIDDSSLTAADRQFDQYAREEDKLTPEQKLQRLENIKIQYNKEMQGKLHSEEFVAAAISVIDEEMTDVRKENVEKFKKKKITPKGDSSAEIDVDRGGELTVSVKRGKETIEADVIEYEVQPVDNITKIATWLSGDSGKVQFTISLLKDLNPQIKNLDRIWRGQRINVPGEYITVPKVKLSALLRQYYPKVRSKDAMYYLKWINSKNPIRDKILVGEVILVPAIR